jgi:metallo-beta-lactamase family protein
MLNGVDEIRIHGAWVPVRAEVRSLDQLSAHADAGQLVQWLRHFPAAPRRIFLVHGEPRASDALRVRIERELGWDAEVPEHGQAVKI